MRRREFIACLGAAAAWPLAARAQQAAMPGVGMLRPQSAGPTTATRVAGFLAGLAEMQFEPGRNVAIEYRWAEGRYDRLKPLAEELVRLKVAVIAAATQDSALAAKAATATIPIAFNIGGDPVRLGLAASMNRPGGNVTGVSFLAHILVGKQLELLQELIPTAKVVGALINPGNPVAATDTAEIEKAAQLLGRPAHIVQARTEQEFDAAFAALSARRVDALLIVPDALFTNGRQRLAALALRHRMPAIYTSNLYTEAGGLASYGTDQNDAFRQIGVYTGRILKGDKASDLPVVQSVKFVLAINLKAAKAFELTIPPTVLTRADEVIE